MSKILVKNTWHWGTLVRLVNEDYADMVAKKIHKPASAAQLLLGRKRWKPQNVKAVHEGLKAALDKLARSPGISQGTWP